MHARAEATPTPTGTIPPGTDTMPPGTRPSPRGGLPAPGGLPALAGLLLCAGLLASPVAAQEEDASLYERIGGYDVIAAVVDDFFARMGEDPTLQPLLAGVSAEEAGRVRQHFVDFFCARAGGPCVYHGQDMASAHEGLGIEDRHFDATLEHMVDALEAHGVGPAERQDLLTMLRGTRGEIVGG